MRPETTCALYDEILKIADGTGDLMNPAVVAESATVDGPPAKPFSRRKGYRRLARPLEKDAGAFRDALRMLKDRAKLTHQATQRHLQRADSAVRGATLKAYAKAPGPLRKAYHATMDIMADPDQSKGIAVGRALKNFLGH